MYNMVNESFICDTNPGPHSQFSINIQLRKYIGRQPDENRGLDSNNIINYDRLQYNFVWGTFNFL